MPTHPMPPRLRAQSEAFGGAAKTSLHPSAAPVYTVPEVMPSTWGLDRTAEGISVHGEVDLSSAEPFAEEASKAVMEAPATSILVDLSGVTFMDSAGLRALIQVLELRSGMEMIVQSSPQVFTLLHLVGLTDGALPNVVVRPP
jgi:anti-sigma B factor antagonist